MDNNVNMDDTMLRSHFLQVERVAMPDDLKAAIMARAVGRSPRRAVPFGSWAVAICCAAVVIATVWVVVAFLGDEIVAMAGRMISAVEASEFRLLEIDPDGIDGNVTRIGLCLLALLLGQMLIGAGLSRKDRRTQSE